MIQNLRAGSPLYIFFKSEPQAVIGEVVRTENPVDQFGNKIFVNGLMQPKVSFIDVVVSVGGTERVFSHLGAESTIADSGAEGVIIADNRQEFVDAITAYANSSKRALSEMDKHQHIVERCEAILFDFDPQKKTEKEQADRIAKLEEGMQDLKEMLARALNRSSSSKNANKEE